MIVPWEKSYLARSVINVLNQLHTISTSRTPLPTTWQSAVFPYAKETRKAVNTSNYNNLSFISALLALMESMNASRSTNFFKCSNHHFSTKGTAPLPQYKHTQHSIPILAPTNGTNSRNVSSVISSWWKFDPHQLVDIKFRYVFTNLRSVLGR